MISSKTFNFKYFVSLTTKLVLELLLNKRIYILITSPVIFAVSDVTYTYYTHYCMLFNTF